MKHRYGLVVFLLIIILSISACSEAATPESTQVPVENTPQPTAELADAPYPAPGGELPTAPAINLAYPEPGSELPDPLMPEAVGAAPMMEEAAWTGFPPLAACTPVEAR